MLRMVDKEYIRKKHFVEGWSIRRISRDLGYSRQAIRRCLQDSGLPRYTLTKPRPAPVMGKWLPIIEQWLRDDETQPKKQRHTAKRIYDRLVAEFAGEFTGSESTVRRVVAQLRGKGRPPEVFVPLTAEPGDLAEIDFQESYAEEDGVLTGLVLAFEWLGGVPRRVRFDNAKAAVKRILPGNQRQETDLFSSLRAHYLFDSEFCNPRKAHEKGAVENLCGFVRRNALVPMPKVRNIDELNRHLLAWCEKDREKHPGWEAEQAALRPLPKDRFRPCVTRLAVVSKQSLVTCDRNRYSVPASLVGQTVRLEIYSDHIDVYHQDKPVASHKRLEGRGGMAVELEHYRDTIAHKRRAGMDGAFVASMPPVYLKARQLLLTQRQGYKEFAAILGLTGEWPAEAVETALARAIGIGRVTAETVRQLLLADMPVHQAPVDVPASLAVSLTPPDLSRYDRLAKGAANS